MERVFYSASVHDEAEINAVVEVLRSGPQGLWPGKRVTAMEREVAAKFGKRRGVMCNSGSSALYLAVELLNLPKGSEVIAPAVVFSTDIAPLVRAGLVPVLVDVESDTYCIDVTRIEAAVTPNTKAILGVNLAGNLPDWDAIRRIADKHGLKVIEDSCDSIGPTLHGTPTGKRSDISVTSFANSHVITAGGAGGMVMLDDDVLRDRALLLRRWGRRSELQYYGSKKAQKNFWEDLDGVKYDNQFIFDELGWNFEPSEMGAAFGLEQLKKLPANWARRQRNFKLYSEWFRQHEKLFVLPREIPGADTVWLGYLLTLKPGAGFERGHLQEYLDSHEVDTRTIWTGNVARQPMMKGQLMRVAPGGLANADAVMERGVMLPLSHALEDRHVEMVTRTVGDFLQTRSNV
jgi:CDP-6-deoxy-D-xylo-4-hexulose-3-dehydrase